MITIDIHKEFRHSRCSTTASNMQINVSIDIETGSFVGLSGASGSGKTSLLRVLAGLDEARGKIVVDGETWLDETLNYPVQNRRVGAIFQDYALFPNMSVLQNLLYIDNDTKLATRLLDMMEMMEYIDREPSKLSGGEQQRVALARAMMRRPKLLLLDEPLSALDKQTRAKIQDGIMRLHREFGSTIIMTSHESEELHKMSDRVIVLEKGQIIDDCNTKELLTHREDSYLQGILLRLDHVESYSIATVSVAGRNITIGVPSHKAKSLKVGDKVKLNASLE